MQNDKRPIATFNNGFNPVDVNFVEESLYRCAKDMYCLKCRGGALSQYAEEREGSLVAGSKDLYLSENEVLEWAAMRFSVDEAVSIFSNR